MSTPEVIELILFWTAVCLISVDAYFIFFHGGVPNIRTAPAIRAHIINLLKQDYAAHGHAGYTVVDVGSGNGLFTREIAKALPQAKVVGIEIAPQSVYWANLFKRKQHLTNLEYVRQDFFKYDFAKSDAVVMFLIPAVLGALGRKLLAEAKPGALITSNKFKLGGDWPAPQEAQIPTRYLHQGKLYIYRKA